MYKYSSLWKPVPRPSMLAYTIFLLVARYSPQPTLHLNIENILGVRKKDMWWLIGSAPDISSRGPRFESSISHNDPDALQDHNEENLRVERETYP